MMKKQLDPSNYLTLPVTKVAAGLTHAEEVLKAALPNPPELIAEDLVEIKASEAALRSAWTERASKKKKNAKLADHRHDEIWRALNKATEAFEHLPSEDPDVQRMLEIREVLFGEGLGFINDSYEVQWAESQKRWQQLIDLNMLEDLKKWLHPLFVKELEAALAHFGDKSGITAPQELVIEENLRKLHRMMRDHIASYNLRVVMHTNAKDPQALEAALKALAPTDALREKVRLAQRRKAAASSGTKPPGTDPPGTDPPT